jgi:hypothetical protein
LYNCRTFSYFWIDIFQSIQRISQRSSLGLLYLPDCLGIIFKPIYYKDSLNFLLFKIRIHFKCFYYVLEALIEWVILSIDHKNQSDFVIAELTDSFLEIDWWKLYLSARDSHRVLIFFISNRSLALFWRLQRIMLFCVNLSMFLIFHIYY